MPAAKKDDGERTRKIVQQLGRAHPDARFELDFTTPLELLVALILAAQFRDDRVNAITPPLFARYRTARAWGEPPPKEAVDIDAAPAAVAAPSAEERLKERQGEPAPGSTPRPVGPTTR